MDKEKILEVIRENMAIEIVKKDDYYEKSTSITVKLKLRKENSHEFEVISEDYIYTELITE